MAVGDAVLSRSQRPPSDYTRLAEDWGASVVRLSVHPGVWLNRGHEVLARLDDEVAGARRAGLSVIIVWHAIGWPDGPEEGPPSYWGMPERSYATDLSLAHDFWNQAARRYASDDSIIFEIWNEPVRLGADHVAPGGTSKPGVDWQELRPIWVEIIKRIRRHAKNRILATGGSWASDLTGVRENPLADERTGYSWHVYPGTAGGSVQELEQRLDWLPASQNVFVTEWGFGHRHDHLTGSAEGFGRMFSECFLQRFALSWTAWCWNPYWQPALIAPDWQTPTESGRLVKDLLKRPSGHPI